MTLSACAMLQLNTEGREYLLGKPVSIALKGFGHPDVTNTYTDRTVYKWQNETTTKSYGVKKVRIKYNKATKTVIKEPEYGEIIHKERCDISVEADKDNNITKVGIKFSLVTSGVCARYQNTLDEFAKLSRLEKVSGNKQPVSPPLAKAENKTETASGADSIQEDASVGKEEFEEGLSALKAKNKNKAQRYFLQAAQKGNTEAQFQLGKSYLDTGYGLSESNLNKSMEWFLKAAKSGHAGAQSHYGMQYLLAYRMGMKGWNEPENAITWLEAAASKNDLDAMETLANLYSGLDANPTIVQLDRVKAYTYFDLALKGGRKSAKYSLAALKKKMTPDELSKLESSQ